MKSAIIFIFLSSFTFVTAQTLKISGRILDDHHMPVIGANVYLEGTYDGTSTDTLGNFTFGTLKKGEVKLVATSLGYSTYTVTISLPSGNRYFDLILKEEVNELNEVVITAGTYQAGDRKRGIQLSALDVLTNPNSNGDIVGALNTLPGTQNVGEDGGIFVRGGDRSETKTFIDGLLVANPYTSKAPDLPSRGRFSPTLFNGTLFSTGGYSAEYGQALSAALILNTNNLIINNPQSINILPFGFGAVVGKGFDSTAVSLSVNYYNLKPYYNLVPQSIKWIKDPRRGSIDLMTTSRISAHTFLKVFAAAGNGLSAFELPEASDPFGGRYLRMLNNDFYINSILTTRVKQVDLKSGISVSSDYENFDFRKASLVTQTRQIQFKQVAQWNLTSHIILRNGVECLLQHYDQKFKQPDSLIDVHPFYDNSLSSVFTETESHFGKDFSLRAGLRGEFSSLNSEFTLSPRFSAAWRTGENSQISAAYGIFSQLPKENYLKINHDISSQQAIHYILNYQYQRDGYLFRVEGYYKDYRHMTCFRETNDYHPEDYSSGGYGYAKGLDIFWRDQKTVRNGDYWVSFTFLDAKKKYENYPRLMYPTYFSRYNASVVYKQFFPATNLQLALTYQYSSGRPYLDPIGNMHYTIDLNELSGRITYLTRMFDKLTVLFLNVSNIPGFRQIYGYNYVKKSVEGEITWVKSPITPPARRFYTIGLFLSLNDKF